MGLMMCEGKFVSRDEIAMVQTPPATESWKPVPHMEVIEAVTDVVKAHNWQIWRKKRVSTRWSITPGIQSTEYLQKIKQLKKEHKYSVCYCICPCHVLN